MYIITHTRMQLHWLFTCECHRISAIELAKSVDAKHCRPLAKIHGRSSLYISPIDRFVILLLKPLPSLPCRANDN
jgi:hypothetical protein